MLFVSCDDNEELIEYYKSQPRDENLMGWWDFGVLHNSFDYWQFTNPNKLEYSHNNNNELIVVGENYYWYTKNGTLYILECHKLEGTYKEELKYEIIGDSLFLDDTFYAIKATSPL